MVAQGFFPLFGMALWCNWLTRRPLKAESPGSSPGNATNLRIVWFSANGRGERIRTSDPLVPNQVRYQTALRPEIVAKIGCRWEVRSCATQDYAA